MRVKELDMNDSHDTMRDTHFLTRLQSALAQGGRVVLASVLATRGSMPRHAGARMALMPSGEFLGTVGGGRVEQMTEDFMRAASADPSAATLEWLTHSKTKMACGGDALVGVRVLEGADDAALIGRLIDKQKESTPFVWRENWETPTSVVREIVELDALAPNDVAARVDVPSWDEKSKLYCEPMGQDPVAYVFGAGHVGRALVPVLASIGFKVAVFDDRPEYVTAERLPQADFLYTGDFKQISDLVRPGKRDYVVVTTHGHAADIDVLAQVAAGDPAYVGCIGSRGKAAFVRRTLQEMGCSKAYTDRVHLPIGEDILAVTPGEIAVSIAAQMIRCRAELRPDRPHQHK